MIAQTLGDIDMTLDNEALTEENFCQYWVDTRDGRGEDPVQSMVRKLTRQPGKNHKFLFAGFSGCGKSTELIRLKQQVEKECLTIAFSIYDRLDPVNFSISEILLAMMEECRAYIGKHWGDISLDSQLTDRLENWSNRVYSRDDRYTSMSGQLAVEGKFSAGFLKFLNAMLLLKGDLKAGRSFSRITEKDEKHTLSELLEIVNALLAAIRQQLPQTGKKNVLFIVEDLEKTTLHTVERLFSEYVNPLTALDCSVIYTFPISLVYHHRHHNFTAQFDELKILPMIKTHEKNGADCKNGIRILREILQKRIAPNLAEEAVWDLFIRYSGGCLRDLFRLLKTAADNALDDNRDRLTGADFRYSATKLKNNYYNNLSFDKEANLATQDYLDILKECCLSEDKKPLDRPGLMNLKHNLSILGYNGEQWFDVHPAVREILKDKKLITES